MLNWEFGKSVFISLSDAHFGTIKRTPEVELHARVKCMYLYDKYCGLNSTKKKNKKKLHESIINLEN